MSERFSDDLDLVAPEDYAPTSVHDLLHYLHLETESRQCQESAVRDWLRKQPAGRAMIYSLHRNGFGHLLDHRDTG